MNILFIVGQLLTMGLPVIEESLQDLLDAMDGMTALTAGISLISAAKALGVSLAVCVGSYESWMMMLGRRPIDVMKIVRIAGLAFCITFSGYICKALAYPGKSMENDAKMYMIAQNKMVSKMELAVAKKQVRYLGRLVEVQDSLNRVKVAEALSEDADLWDKIQNTVSAIGESVSTMAKMAIYAHQTALAEMWSQIFRFIGEIILQMCYYGILIAQRVFMRIMEMIAPIMFALSIVPPWSSAWSQWMSKYLSLSLWGFVTYFVMYYVDAMLIYGLQKDMMAYDHLMGSGVDGVSWGSVMSMGFSQIGTTASYVMGLLVGAWIIRMIPEVSSWLIPGGVNASVAGSSVSFVTGAAPGLAKQALGFMTKK